MAKYGAVLSSYFLWFILVNRISLGIFVVSYLILEVGVSALSFVVSSLVLHL